MLTNTVPGRLALRAGSLNPHSSQRLGPGRLRIHAEAPGSGAGRPALEDRVQHLAQQVLGTYERWIQEAPGEWMAMARRWPKALELEAINAPRLGIAPREADLCTAPWALACTQSWDTPRRLAPRGVAGAGSHCAVSALGRSGARPWGHGCWRVLAPEHGRNNPGGSNAARVTPQLSEAERAKVLRASWESTGAVFAEYTHLEALASPERLTLNDEADLPVCRRRSGASFCWGSLR